MVIDMKFAQVFGINFHNSKFYRNSFHHFGGGRCRGTDSRRMLLRGLNKNNKTVIDPKEGPNLVQLVLRHNIITDMLAT